MVRHLQMGTIRFQKLYQDPPSAFPARIALGQTLKDLIRLHDLDGHRIAPLMKRLGLPWDLLARLPDAVSAGELHRLALFRVLLLDRTSIFADEPTSRLDLVSQAEVVNILVEQSRERNMAVIFVSHDHELMQKTADYVIELKDGKISRRNAGLLQ